MDEEAIQARIDAAVAAALEAAAAAAPHLFLSESQLRSWTSCRWASCSWRPLRSYPGSAKDGIINYGTSDGMKLYNAAVQALATKYSGKAGDMHLFLKAVGKRAQKFDGTGLSTSPWTMGRPGTCLNSMA
ncbi:hypothetical protein MHU86_22050 [Fragilaria crotonensis]|nr:hypothetical protein MHU86_22050 [Fragilaria crotonensis]